MDENQPTVKMDVRLEQDDLFDYLGKLADNNEIGDDVRLAITDKMAQVLHDYEPLDLHKEPDPIAVRQAEVVGLRDLEMVSKVLADRYRKQKGLSR